MERRKIHNKEIIKSRMFKSARDIWGIVNMDNFDPFIQMLIEALASEVEKINTETVHIETRLIEQVAELLTPDKLKSVQPAHTVLHAMPQEGDKIMLGKRHEFSYDTPASENLKFFPVAGVPLLNGYVGAMIHTGGYYSLSPGYPKTLRMRSRAFGAKQPYTCWIGLKLPDSLPSFSDCSFFFDISFTDSKDLYQLLPYTIWEHQGRKLSVRSGIHTIESKKTNTQDEFGGFSTSHIPDKRVLDYYNHHFLTIKDEVLIHPSVLKIVPDELSSSFNTDELQDDLQPLLWIKVTCPPAFGEDMVLENLTVWMNAFPVINKALCSGLLKVSPLSSVLPLKMSPGEYFLSVETVSDSFGNNYSELPYVQQNHSHTPTYVVKRGGMERFDARDAKLTIQNLLSTLQEEAAAFTTMGTALLGEHLKKVYGEIQNIENKLTDINREKDTAAYLIIDTKEPVESVFVDYWVTNCETANYIKAGNTFSTGDKDKIAPASVISLTRSTGGKSVSNNRTADIYKYILTSRDTVYTDSDISNFCMAFFGDIIESVDVRKGVAVSTVPHEGMIRTIDLYITLRSAVRQQREDGVLDDIIIRRLKERSPAHYNYRVFLTH